MRNLLEEPVESYRVALLAPRIRRRGFEALRVRLEKEGEVLVDELFTDPRAAEAFLDGRVLEIGTLGGVSLVVSPTLPGFRARSGEQQTGVVPRTVPLDGENTIRDAIDFGELERPPQAVE